MSEFDDDDIEDMDDEESESWKPIYTFNKELQLHIKKISETLQSLVELTNDKDDFTKSQVEMMLGDSWNVQAKLRGARAADMYLVYMENASIIRSLMRQMKSFTYGLEMENTHGEGTGIESSYIKVLREEVEQFRNTFCEWVKTFTKDDFEDEWGLY